MPGDAVNSGGISFLDVQFGALEFGSDSNSLEGTTADKYGSSNATVTGIDVANTNAVNSAGQQNSLDIEGSQTSSNQFNSASQMVGF